MGRATHIILDSESCCDIKLHKSNCTIAPVIGFLLAIPCTVCMNISASKSSCVEHEELSCYIN